MSLSLPHAAEPLLSAFSIAFTRPTFQRAMVLLVGLILTVGRRTVTRTLWTARPLAVGALHRLPPLLLPRPLVLVAAGPGAGGDGVGTRPAADEPAQCPVDDTAAQHRGKHVYGKGRHRDACRSSNAHTVWLWGHRWVILAINVRLAFASSRPWALPVLIALYRPRELNEREGRRRRRHKTPIVLARQLIATLMHWFPARSFILLGDGGFASHELAQFCHRHRRRLTLVSLLHPQAHLCDAPPAPRPGRRMGRPRVRGTKLPHPQDVVARPRTTKRKRATVGWYGGGKRRRIEFVSGVGHWYKATEGLVPIRWVFVHDRDGTHDDDRYVYSTDPSMSPSRIVTLYTGRWSIEVTIQEAKQHLGLATPRNRKDASVLRTAPCLLGCFSVVTILFHRCCCPARGNRMPRPAARPWYVKRDVTFSDALTAVRRLLWRETVFTGSRHDSPLKKLPFKLRETLLERLSCAA